MTFLRCGGAVAYVVALVVLGIAVPVTLLMGTESVPFCESCRRYFRRVTESTLSFGTVEQAVAHLNAGIHTGTVVTGLRRAGHCRIHGTRGKAWRQCADARLPLHRCVRHAG